MTRQKQGLPAVHIHNLNIEHDRVHGTSQSVRKDSECGGGELILPFHFTDGS
jgi:hypothetical protein